MALRVTLLRKAWTSQVDRPGECQGLGVGYGRGEGELGCLGWGQISVSERTGAGVSILGKVV